MARRSCQGRAPRRSPARATCRRWQRYGPSLLLPNVAVALDRAAAANHHVAVLLLSHPGHAAGHLLEALAISRADLREEVDVAAKCDAAIEVAREHGLLLLLAHRPLVEISAFVGLEARAVLRLHQRHTELVEMIALARHVGIEYRRAGYVLVGFVERHGVLSSGIFGPVQPHWVVDQQLAL